MVRKTFTISNINTEISIPKSFRSYLGAIVSGNAASSVFAHIAMGLKIQEDSSIRTMCVTVVNGHYLLKYSPDMVKELDVFATSIVLAHEMAHLSLDHVSRLLRIDAATDPKLRSKYMRVLHQAADYAVNSWLIDDLRMFTLSDLRTKIGENGKYRGIHPSDINLPTGKSLEWYAKKILEKLDNIPEEVINELTGGGDSESKCKSGGGGGESNPVTEALKNSPAPGEDTSPQILDKIPEELLAAMNGESNNEDNVSMVSDSAAEEGKTAQEISQDLSRTASELVKDAMNSKRGFLPGTFISKFEEVFSAPKVRWQDVLKRVTSSSRPAHKNRSIVKPRRNMADLGRTLVTSEFPGRVKLPEYHIIFAIDTSGSVQDRDIQLIFDELQGLLKEPEVSITVVEADATVQKVYSLRDTRGKIDRKIYGRGGTDFNHTFRLIKNGHFKDFKVDPADLVIYATDGECTNPDMENRIPSRKVLWLSTTGTVPSDNSWGKAVDTSSIKGMADYGSYILINK